MLGPVPRSRPAASAGCSTGCPPPRRSCSPPSCSRTRETAGCTRIGDCDDRQIVKVTGTLRTVTLRPRAGVPALEAELFDGSAALDVVWLGRRSIVGIEPGRKLIASGRVSMSHGRRVLFNPKYELRPLGQE